MSHPAPHPHADTPAPDYTLDDAYSLWAVWRRDPLGEPGWGDDAIAAADLDRAIAGVEANGVTVRGFYDVSGLRADADVLVWLHGGGPAGLQRALRELRRTDLLRTLHPTWNAMGVHREAEFTRSHVPAYLRGIAPAGWLTLYPFVRSYEWYLLPDEERRAMLAEHGRKGAAYRSVLTNTVASFALGDYEWLLPLEADDPIDLVDLMRHLRQTDARRHVREEVPFFTGRRVASHELPEVIR
ncbi:hydrogen peroxide-dependent heme synthase [uncultured Microbacterium sp.]|uniref:hydrogen peroxide-dependent heme synthase n=1 Tax=uncultured Microbacterium sp. TaxID=191216 RepID=UPI0035CBE02E